MKVRKAYLATLLWAILVGVVNAQVSVPGSVFDPSSTQVITGSWTFIDSLFKVCDDGDNTKCWSTQASGITTGNNAVAFGVRGTAAAPSLVIPDGTSSEPGAQFLSDADASGTGIYRFSTNAIGFSANGGGRAVIDNGGLNLGTNQLSWGTTVGSGDVAFTRVAAGIAGQAAGTWVQQSNGYAALNADYTNATTTFSNTALSRTLLITRTYTFTAALLLTESVAADGVKLDFAGGAATATVFGVTCNLSNAVGAQLTQTNATSNALATVINIAATTDANQHIYNCAGYIVTSGAGTFILRAAQNAHSTGTLTIKRGSWIAVVDTPAL